jgi:hypothetical protein
MSLLKFTSTNDARTLLFKTGSIDIKTSYIFKPFNYIIVDQTTYKNIINNITVNYVLWKLFMSNQMLVLLREKDVRVHTIIYDIPMIFDTKESVMYFDKYAEYTINETGKYVVNYVLARIVPGSYGVYLFNTIEHFLDYNTSKHFSTDKLKKLVIEQYDELLIKHKNIRKN